MIRDREVFVVWKGHEYVGIQQLGFSEGGSLIVSLWTTPPAAQRGSYFTGIPISPKEWRTNPENRYLDTRFWPKGRCEFKDHGRYLSIRDDWREVYEIAAPREILDLLVQDLVDNAVPAAPESP